MYESLIKLSEYLMCYSSAFLFGLAVGVVITIIYDVETEIKNG